MTNDSTGIGSENARLPRGFDPEMVTRAILALAAACGSGETVTPADVARYVAPGEHWQRALPEVRRMAVTLAQAGRLLIYRRGKVIDPADLRGVYRLGLPHDD